MGMVVGAWTETAPSGDVVVLAAACQAFTAIRAHIIRSRFAGCRVVRREI